MPAKVMLGLSGGVDSSVAAIRLLEQGYDVEALFMKNWEEDDDAEYCAATEDLADAEAVCERLGLTLHTVNFATEYWDRVFEHFLTEYGAGRTPNPDVLCNQEIKFRAFLDHARWLGAEAIATGHYARLRRTVDGVELLRGLDADKDQSYFLYRLNQSQLDASLFPLGEMHKPAVRAAAQAAALRTHDKKDSTGICFIGERRFKDFLERFLPARPGPIQTLDGATLGEHHGLMYHTIGQRKGLGIGGLRQAADSPWYVVDKRVAENVLVVAQGHDHPYLLRRRLQAAQLNWIAGQAPAAEFRCSARIRYRQSDQACRVRHLADDRIEVEFDQAQRAVTPGQSVVFYADAICLGGGIIDCSE